MMYQSDGWPISFGGGEAMIVGGSHQQMIGQVPPQSIGTTKRSPSS